MSIEEEVKNDLQQLALTDWDKFVKLINLDISSLEVCKRRKKGQTLQQIANAMQMPRSTVQRKCDTC